MDVLVDRRLEGPLIDRTPARFIRKSGGLRECAGLLVRDQVDHVALKFLERTDQGPGLGIDRLDDAALCPRDPFDHVAVVLLPAGLEQRLFGEGVLGVEDHDLGFGLVGREIVRNLRGALVGARWAAEWIRRRDDVEDASVIHRLQLSAQDVGLLAGLPGVRDPLGDRLGHAFDRRPVVIHAGGDDQLVVVVAVGARAFDEVLCGVDLDHGVLHHGDPAPSQAAVVEGETGQVALAAEHLVAERAGDIGRVFLD